MKIAFFTNLSDIKAGGVFTYSIGILKLFIKSDEIKQIFLICHKDQMEYFRQYSKFEKIRLIQINRNQSCTKLLYYISTFLFETCFLYEKYFKTSKFLRLLAKFSVTINPYFRKIKKYSPDILYFPYQYAQIYASDIPSVITMHDVQELHFPENFNSDERIHRAINTAKALFESDAVIVSFDHIKKDIVKYFDVGESKINVCVPPISESWFSQENSTDYKTLQMKYDISNKFILYPAATWIHKNHSKLIQALKILRDKKIIVSLVCTGYKTDYYDKLAEQIELTGLSNQVKFLGIVSEEDLIGLYKSTSLVIVPTLYEAGSGPLFEAMRYNAPVVCSRTTSLPETISNDKFVFNPNDENDIASIIEKGLFDNDFRKENLSNSKQRIEYYAKYEYLNAFINVFKNITEKSSLFPS